MVFPSKHSRGRGGGVKVWPRAQNTAVTEKQSTSSFSNRGKEDQMCFFCLPCCGAWSPNIHKFEHYIHTDLLLMFTGWFNFLFFVFAALGWINNSMQARIPSSVMPAFLYSGKVKPPCLCGSVFLGRLYFVWPKQRVSFPHALKSFHTVKADIDLFFFFFFP